MQFQQLLIDERFKSKHNIFFLFPLRPTLFSTGRFLNRITSQKGTSGVLRRQEEASDLLKPPKNTKAFLSIAYI